MSPELDQYLCKKYPKIFSERNKSPQESCMHWGLECGDGWFSILDTLCSSIQRRVDRQYSSQVVFGQVKEKVSALRIYSSGGDEYTDALIEFAEQLSMKTCEVCGRMDETVGRNKHGWIKTTCVQHSGDVSDFYFNNPETASISSIKTPVV